MSQVPVLASDRTMNVQADNQATKLFPTAKKDVNDQQVDLRRVNSWLLKLDEVSTGEAAEVLAINTLAPFVINVCCARTRACAHHVSYHAFV